MKNKKNNFGKSKWFEIIAISTILFLSSNLLKAQDETDYFQNYGSQSSGAYAASLVNNIPISLFTGRISPVVQLLKKKMSILDFNLSISYIGGGGLKVNDPGSNIGKGWDLNCGGMIIRNKRGVPDDFKSANPIFSGILYNGGIPSKADGQTERISKNGLDLIFCSDNGRGDTQHDIFEYAIPGKSGKFYIGKNKDIILTDESSIKIVPTFNTDDQVGHKLESFTIVDESGITYYFNQIEKVKGRGKTDEIPQLYSAFDYGSAWLLTKTESPDKEEYIEFEFQDEPYQPSQIMSLYTYIKSQKSNELQLSENSSRGLDILRNKVTLKSVNFSDGTHVLFEYFVNETIDRNNTDVVSAIKLVNRYDETIEHFRFQYKYFDIQAHFSDMEPISSSLVIRPVREHSFLTNITKVGSNQKELPFYAFQYYINQEQYAATYTNIYSGMKDVDFWGYYNGKDNRTKSLIPVFPETNPGDRNPDLAYTTTGALKSIHYPAGGYESFEYELNEKKNGNTNEVLGGLRIKRRTLHDGINSENDQIREYRYIEEDGKSSGFLGDPIEFNYTYNVYDGVWPGSLHLKYTLTTATSEAVNPLSSVEGSPVGYRRVEEIFKNGNGTNGKTVYDFTDLSYAQSALWSPLDQHPYRPVDRPTWAVGLPLHTTVFNADGLPVKKITNSYAIKQELLVNENFRSLHVAKAGEFVGYPNDGFLVYIYRYKNYYPIIGQANLIKTTEENFSGTSPTLMSSSEEEFIYDQKNRIKSSVGKNYKEQPIKKLFYYPDNYSLNTSSSISQLVQKNIISNPVSTESWLYKENKWYLLNAAATDFSTVYGLVRPSCLYSSRLDNPVAEDVLSFDNTKLLQDNYNMKADIVYDKYNDKGILLSDVKAGSLRSTILVNKSNNIIVKAQNAIPEELFFSNFEDPNEWDSNMITIQDGSGIGVIINQTTSEKVSHSNQWLQISLNSGKKFKFSGWIYSDGPTAEIFLFMKTANEQGYYTNIESVQTAVKNKWVYVEKEVTVPQNIKLLGIRLDNNGIGNVWFNDIRLYPANVLLSTYTYKDGIGVSSETDSKGLTLKYEYDEFNRLKNKRDRDNNILQNLTYHQKEPLYQNAEKTRTLTSYSCPEGFTSAPVNYVVPAGKYSSYLSVEEANEKAEDDLAYNGLAYADQIPNCITEYRSDIKTGQINKDNCLEGRVCIKPYTFTLPEGYFLSTVSKEDANRLADENFNQLAQSAANSASDEEYCAYKTNLYISNNSSTEFRIRLSRGGDTFEFDVPANKYSVLSVPQLDNSQLEVFPKNNTSFTFDFIYENSAQTFTENNKQTTSFTYLSSDAQLFIYQH